MPLTGDGEETLPGFHRRKNTPQWEKLFFGSEGAALQSQIENRKLNMGGEGFEPPTYWV
jgi:hypothetical protein